MNGLESILEQARVYVVQNVPPALLDRAVLVGLGLVLAGVVVGVLGAKMAKPGLTLLVALAGGLGGAVFARDAGVHQLIGALVGAAMLGTVAFVTFRFWVGLAAALVLCSLAMGTFGYREVLPHVPAFEQAGILPPERQAAVSDVSIVERWNDPGGSPQRWARELWTYVTQQDHGAERNSRLVGVGALVTGLFLGVVLVKVMLVVSTSVIGTMLAASGAGTVLSSLSPKTYAGLGDHPGLLGMGVGAFLVTSVILQTMLLRKAAAASEEGKKKS